MNLPFHFAVSVNYHSDHGKVQARCQGPWGAERISGFQESACDGVPNEPGVTSLASCWDVRTFNFLLMDVPLYKPLKVKLLAGEQKATEFTVPEGPYVPKEFPDLRNLRVTNSRTNQTPNCNYEVLGPSGFVDFLHSRLEKMSLSSEK